jgi:hypothetical protein
MADRNLSVVLGPRILGKEAFEAQREQMSKEAGSVGLGDAFNKPFVPNVTEDADFSEQPPVEAAVQLTKRQQRQQRQQRKQAAAGKASVPSGKGKGTAPKPPKSEAGKGKKNAPKTVEFSESDAVRLLTADANIWPKILDAETKRPEGPRLAVATALLDAGGKAKREVMPKEIIALIKGMLNLDPTAE